MSQSWQKQITEITVLNSKLLADYGDYSSNIGSIAINPFDITSSSFEGVAVTFPIDIPVICILEVL